MKKKLSLVLGTILALSLCLLTACGGDDPAPLGAYDNDELGMSIVFSDDGTCVVSDFDMSYEAEFEMDGDELTIKNDDLGMEVTGTYDADTTAGVRRAQAVFLLPQTGETDRATWEALALFHNSLFGRTPLAWLAAEL